MKTENSILKHSLRYVYYLTGTAHPRKTTTVQMLANRHDMVCCAENDHGAVSEMVDTPDSQPDIPLPNTLTDWKAFVTRTPEEYKRRIDSIGKEAAEFEAAELFSISKIWRVIADTHIPVEILNELSDDQHVAGMLSPQSMSVERFFDRSDPENCFFCDRLGHAASSVFALRVTARGFSFGAFCAIMASSFPGGACTCCCTT